MITAYLIKNTTIILMLERWSWKVCLGTTAVARVIERYKYKGKATSEKEVEGRANGGKEGLGKGAPVVHL